MYPCSSSISFFRLLLLVFFCFSVFVFFATPVNAGQLVYSTWFGKYFDWVEGRSIACDAAGNAYVTGYTSSSTFPITPGVFDTSYNGGVDVFVMKLNSNGTALVYSTYLGGDGNDIGYGITVDSTENAYLTGITTSPDFPTTSDAFDTSYNEGGDVFVTELNPSGTALVYSTYLGGENEDKSYGIDIDSEGNAYIIGYTASSTDFPTTSDVFDTLFNGGGYDGFVSKLNPRGTELVYSTYLGGNSDDIGYGIALDSSGSAYVTGWTYSTDYPTTSGAFDTSFKTEDGFVSKLNPSGTELVYSSYLGGSDHDQGYGIAVDISGNAFITGRTASTDFPTTPGALDTTYHSCFISKLNSDGTGLVYSTFFGGSGNENSYAIAVDAVGNVYLTGGTTSPDFPTTPDAFDTSYNGSMIPNGGDAFVSALTADVSDLIYSTYLGGSYWEYGYGIAVDASNNTYVTGFTYSTDFPKTTNPRNMAASLLPTHGEAFVTKFALAPAYWNNHGAFLVDRDTTHWLFEKYGDAMSKGYLSWISTYHCITLTQAPGEKGKLTQVFSVPSTGWYTATVRVLTDISEVDKQQKVYLYLQQLDKVTAIVATGNQVVQPGAGGLIAGSWKKMQISFYATESKLGVQVVAINNVDSGVTGSLYIDDIWVYAGGPAGTNLISLTNPSFNLGTDGWLYERYADGTGLGLWSTFSRISGHTDLLVGIQGGGEKAKISQIYGAPTSTTLGSVWVYSGATSKNITQKVYLYIYSYDSGYTKVIESGNAILQPGKWTPNQWHQLQFWYTPFTSDNTVQLVAIDPIGNPYEAIYFDEVELKQ